VTCLPFALQDVNEIQVFPHSTNIPNVTEINQNVKHFQLI